MKEPLPPGLYERIVDAGLLELLNALRDDYGWDVQMPELDPAESHELLSRHLMQLLRRTLHAMRGAESPGRQVELCNRIVDLIAQCDPAATARAGRIAEPASQLLSLRPPEPALLPSGSGNPQRPQTPLATSSLLTGSQIDPQLLQELIKEFTSADSVDLLCSFIKWTGVRALEAALREFTAREGVRLRVITTTYMGATDARAASFLAGLPRTEVRVSHDGRRTRLHAKAYIFHRKSDFGTAYIGSSNLSNAALTDGLEWNVKLCQYDAVHLWKKLSGTFETCWQDGEYEVYSPEGEARLRAALKEARGDGSRSGPAYHWDIRPHPYQLAILDRLQAERDLQGRARQLVVAATGTGKTVIAALDYRRFCESSAGASRPRLLVVAHRQEILEQSLHCFRGVLRDQNWGDLLVGSHEPVSSDHLFVSIQSYNARRLYEKTAPDHYDYIVVDEFHHAQAPSYRRLLEHVRPRVLLGLTATPERADGLDILHYFDGRFSAEIRLPEAINRKLLSPFQYFGVSDSVDLSGLTWRRGGYAQDELDRLFTGNASRADLVVRQVHQKLRDPRRARGLGFCVSVQHAQFMAGWFSRAGIPSEAVSGETPQADRDEVQGRLRRGEINFIFSVDLYNEGVDIPEVDTVLLLRPTESLTLFLQQIGRGLRLYSGKDCLTILDFIGQAHRSFNWEGRFRALMDRTRRSMVQEIEDGCVHVPLGCLIQLERVAQQRVLQNIRQAITAGQSGLIRRIRDFQIETGRPLTLHSFLRHHDLPPAEIFRRGAWSRLRHRAGVSAGFHEEGERELTSGMHRIAAWWDSPWLIRTLREIIHRGGLPRDECEQKAAVILHATLWGTSNGRTLKDGYDRLAAAPHLRADLLELLDYRWQEISEVPPVIDDAFWQPLELHASYSRDEALAALGWWAPGKPLNMREGVLYIPELKADIFFATLNKSERDYTPSTLYEDYAISPDLFHWQSQSTTSETSPTAQRYMQQTPETGRVLLFVREEKRRNGITAAFRFLGPAGYVSHEGSRPMSIIWRLRRPLPSRFHESFIRLAA